VPFLLDLDISALALSFALSAGLLLAVSTAGLFKPLNRSFVLFAAAETGFVVCSILLRLSLHFSTGNPETLLELASLFFALSAAALLLFCIRFMNLRGWWPLAAVGAMVAGMLVLLPALLEEKLVQRPYMSPEGLVFYGITGLGFFSMLIPSACLLAASVLVAAARRRERAWCIALSVILQFGGFVVGGLAQPHFPIMALANVGSVAFLGVGVVRLQLFNPLGELAANLRERAHRQELIAEIGTRTTTLLPLDELLDQAASLIRSSFDYFAVAVFLVEGDDLVLRASTLPGVRENLNVFRLKVGREGLCGWVAAEGQPLLVGDVRQDARYVGLLDSRQTKSELAVPIRRSNRVIGVLDAQSRELNAFGDRDLLTLRTVADQLSSSIENARLYEETRQRAERLALVNRISAASGSVLDLDDLLETVYREVTPIFEADAFFLALLDEASGVLEFRLQVDEGRREPPARATVGPGLTSRVVATRAPVLLNDLRDIGETALLWGSGKVPASWVGVPMLVGERLVGVMSVQSYRQRRYDADDVLLAATIAEQVAVAVENARLYEKVTRELEVRLRTEKGLRESEEKFRNLAEETPSMIFIYADRRVMYANRQCEVSTGYAREALYAPGFDLRSLMAPGYEAIASQSLRQGAEGEEVPPYEVVLVTREGRPIDAILTTRRIGYQGAPAVLGIVTDITARKRAERLLQSLNAATLAMEQALTPAEIFPSAVRVLAGLGLDSAVFLSCNDTPRVLRTHCRSSARSGGVRVLDAGDVGGLLLPYDAAADVADAMDGRQALYSTQDPDALALFFGVAPEDRAQGGGVLFVPLVLEDVPFGLLVIAGEDLGPEDLQVFTAFAHQAAAAWRKTRLMGELESSLEKLGATQKQLLHSQKMEAVGRLAGGIAHDFNNLLTVISGYASLLADGLEGNAPALSDLGQIRTTVKRASALTSRLLTFSRKQIVQPEVLDLNKVVAASVTLLRPLIGEDIELVVRLCPEALWIRADQGQLDQVLMNLAVNARDAMPGGGTLLLETSLSAGGDSGPEGLAVQLRVQDDGVGMTEDTRTHVFEPFFTTKEEGKGSGLGLSTVYGIVTQSGGRIRVDSMPGRGTTFVVALPRQDEEAVHAAPEAGLRRVADGSGTILLVEDEQDVRDLTTRVLERGGYFVVPVSSAREALLVAEGSTRLDLVVSDVVMPGGMSGLEMGERLSRSRPDLPVLYISGYTDDMELPSRADGRNPDFLGKPFQPIELLAKVKSVIGER
jgi:PAS domain S-box-containing protein